MSAETSRPTGADRTDRTRTFHALHHRDAPLLLPNAWDAASAVALAAAGFAAVGTTSLGVAAALGEPDGQGSALVRDATLALARRLGSRLACPYTVDIEGGFGGGPEEVGQLARELAGAGASGVNLEDGLPGRAGDGPLVPAQEQAELIRAVKESAPGLYVNARIDTHWLVADPAERPLDETLRRAETYLSAGADGIFVPGVADERAIATLVAAIPAPLNILYAPGRHRLARLAELGVRRVSTGSLLFRSALHAAVGLAESVRADDLGAGLAGVPGYGEVQRLAGLE
ncbi:isocitrate lyase/phosphoenolpyruvate mutase family protein [Streptomyces rimosus]|uniref:isocitrate lyase/PEP mutase family protein n=1 Tax=Streptomyces rimosus TaxID=1927 RepID=UPI00067B198D|nr:isocitrate lyase/phosphoenolpyruvate mutase family protein [Streptomyces rimosus]